MPARDFIHNAVKNALVKDGWTITDDPYIIEYEDVTLFTDLGAERTLAAQRGEQKIAVEIKSFVSVSAVQDFKEALGQFILYRSLLLQVEPERQLYLAISEDTYRDTFQRKSIQHVVQLNHVPLIVVDTQREEVITWIN